MENNDCNVCLIVKNSQTWLLNTGQDKFVIDDTLGASVKNINCASISTDDILSQPFFCLCCLSPLSIFATQSFDLLSGPPLWFHYRQTISRKICFHFLFISSARTDLTSPHSILLFLMLPSRVNNETILLTALCSSSFNHILPPKVNIM